MKKCDLCEGAGEMPVYGFVYPNEPHTAVLDTKPCLCQGVSEENEEYDED